MQQPEERRMKCKFDFPQLLGKRIYWKSSKLLPVEPDPPPVVPAVVL